MNSDAGLAIIDHRFVLMNVPLVTAAGGPLFNQSDPSLVGKSVFVQFVVSLIDSTGTPATTTLNAAVPVALGGVNTWCYGQSAAATKASDYLDGVDLLVGSAGTLADLARLQSLVGLQLTTAPGTLSASTSTTARSPPPQTLLS